jgi:hypothetical protein
MTELQQRVDTQDLQPACLHEILKTAERQYFQASTGAAQMT